MSEHAPSRAQALAARWLGVGLAAVIAVVTLGLGIAGQLTLYISPETVWFACTAAVTRYVSLASMLGGVAIFLASVTLYGPRSSLTAVSLVVAAFVIWNHRANIGRLRRGEEARLGQRARPA